MVIPLGGRTVSQSTKQQAAQVAVILAVIGLAFLMSGCRTYYVYQFGDRPSINVDAAVDKEINPSVKASLQ